MMTETPKPKHATMSCEEFQAQLPDLVGSGQNLAEHEHIRNCELCRALLADLETIAEAARQLFPVEEPPDRLWDQIESAIRSENAPGSGGGRFERAPQPK
jgi:predicted anti-sigma-YlaC factor YlaD